jgi:hypothetical protein
LIWSKNSPGFCALLLIMGSREVQPACLGVDMTSETVKILLLILMFGGLEAARCVEPVVLKRRSRERQARR